MVKIKSNVEVTVSPIKIDFNAEILKILEQVEKSCADDIRKNSPKREPGKREYADAWTYEVDKKAEVVTVYNDGKQKTLPHLLELGHLTRPSQKGYGKGSQRRVPPQEHIRPSYNKSKKEYMDKLNHIKINIK